MRMFVAVELDQRARAAVEQEQRRARRLTGQSSLRLADLRQVHLTLAFLGEIQPPLTDRVIEAMQTPIEGVGPFQIAIGGLGVFPPRGAPRVLWVGLSAGVQELNVLQRAVAGRLDALGVKLEDRPFHPHLTIGRWRHSRPSDRPAFEDGEPSRRAGAMAVDRVTLFESRLSSEGPIHIPLASAPLT